MRRGTEAGASGSAGKAMIGGSWSWGATAGAAGGDGGGSGAGRGPGQTLEVSHQRGIGRVVPPEPRRVALSLGALFVDLGPRRGRRRGAAAVAQKFEIGQQTRVVAVGQQPSRPCHG